MPIERRTALLVALCSKIGSDQKGTAVRQLIGADLQLRGAHHPETANPRSRSNLGTPRPGGNDSGQRCRAPFRLLIPLPIGPPTHAQNPQPAVRSANREPSDRHAIASACAAACATLRPPGRSATRSGFVGRKRIELTLPLRVVKLRRFVCPRSNIMVMVVARTWPVRTRDLAGVEFLAQCHYVE